MCSAGRLFRLREHTDVARYLLAHGAVHTLFSAVAMGEAGVVRKLAQSAVALNQRMDRTNSSRTALHLAVVKKQAAALRADRSRRRLESRRRRSA